MPIEPDTKDWTWVLERGCPDCGFVATDVPVAGLSQAILDNAAAFAVALAGPAVTTRPSPEVWSVTEYACHVRDVHRLFERRVRSMLEEDEPRFDNWDQDETAVAERYDQQDPVQVGPELISASAAAAATYAGVPDRAWQRRGIRSNGSEFTVQSLGRYHLHDVVHHLHDVAISATSATVAAYDASAAAYADGVGRSDDVTGMARRFAGALAAGARVLEIGSGPGRDAALLEEHGLSVRRTDVTPGFVELMRADGHPADVLDPLIDDLDDPQRPGTPYDAVWASACLLHVARPDLPVVLRRLAGATRPGGRLQVTLKEGDGEEWSTHGHIDAPRHFTYWRAEPLRAAMTAAGWEVDAIEHHDGLNATRWLDVVAMRRAQ